ncbi:MAG: ABC transporter permease, partial [Planctomycetota bacterium]
LIRVLRHNRTLFRDFVARDLKSRYVGSSMGFFWSVVFPIINLVVFTFVFRVILNTRWGDDQGALEVALVMLAGIVVWTAFAESLSRSTNCLVDNANLIQKVVFPAQILPTYITTSAVLNMCIGLPILFGSVLWFGYVSEPRAAIEREVHYESVWEGYDPAAENAPAPPRVFLSMERAWREPTSFRVEYGGTATRGVDYIAPYETFELPADRARLFIPISPVRDAEVEGDETIEIRVVESGGRELWQDRVSLTLKDNQLPPEELRDIGLATEPYTAADLGESRALSLGPSLIALPVLLLLLVAFTVGLGSALATLNVYWRDTYHLIGVLTTVWMFATPIFYPASLVKPTPFWWLLPINPMHWFIEMFRQVTLFGEWPDPTFFALFSAATLLVLWFGSQMFAKHQERFPDLL